MFLSKQNPSTPRQRGRKIASFRGSDCIQTTLYNTGRPAQVNRKITRHHPALGRGDPRQAEADAVVLPTALGPGEIPAIKAESGLLVEVFVHCRPEILLQGKCQLPGYAREGAAPPERPRMAGTGTPSSAKRSGRCHLVCRAIPLVRDLHSIEDMLAPWVAAGVDVFKVQGRELSPARLFDLVSRVRGKLDAAVAAVAGNPA